MKNQELTITAIVMGLILSVVMGAANVYLGLRAGMTVSASIPAAVIAMGVLQGVFRRKSILEANLVQTSASAGESLAAGIIFTMPALVMIGVWEDFDFWTTGVIALSGGLLGILFMIPMRRVFIVESPELKYPEGIACAEVLRAGESDTRGETRSGSFLVFSGLMVGGGFKFLVSLFGLLKGSVAGAFFASNRAFYFGLDISPALVSVGVIVGLPVAMQIFLGGAIGWLVVIPLLKADPSLSAIEAAEKLWSTQVRYIGVGTMVVGGVYSIWRVRNGLVYAVKDLFSQYRRKVETQEEETEVNLGGKALSLFTLVCIGLIFGFYYIFLDRHLSITVLVTVIMIVMAFFFTAVASYIVGLVGNSNSPVSGMTITTILITGLLIYLFGYSGTEGILATLGVAGVVCCVACTSGDVCNDLKTGYLLKARPRSQQILQILGVLAAAFILAPVMSVLHEGSLNQGTGGIGGRELPAPQAGLFASLVDGFFGNGQLPWGMVGIGIGIGVFILLLDFLFARGGIHVRLHVMPVAVGIYLPLELSVPIFLGGLLHFCLSRLKNAVSLQRNGVLVSSGVIAGESLAGVFLGFLAYMEYRTWDWGSGLGPLGGDLLSIVMLGLVMVWIVWQSRHFARS